MPLSAGLTWKVEGEKTEESSSQGKTGGGEESQIWNPEDKDFSRKEGLSKEHILQRGPVAEAPVWSFDYENPLEIIC